MVQIVMNDCKQHKEVLEVRITVYRKGGIGKSTTSYNIHIALARHGECHLYIECRLLHPNII